MRFNLRIKHVHRGLLLGTGPLVDPGFHGKILIPLHNLTSEVYKIKKNEGLIWVEFTKTSSFKFNASGAKYADLTTDEFMAIESIKTDKPIEYYFEAANRNAPIKSSIPTAMRATQQEAEKAAKDARGARQANQFLAGIGLFAILSLVVSLYSFIQTADKNQRDSEIKATTAEAKAGRVLEDLRNLSAQDIGHRLTGAEQQILYLRSELEKLKLKQPAPK